jgi:hypothetical protein
MRLEKKLLSLGAAAVLTIVAAACQINMGGQGAQSPESVAADAASIDPNTAETVPLGPARQVQRVDRKPRPVEADAGPPEPAISLDAGLPFDAAALSLDAAAGFIRR